MGKVAKKIGGFTGAGLSFGQAKKLGGGKKAKREAEAKLEEEKRKKENLNALLTRRRETQRASFLSGRAASTQGSILG